MTAGPVAFEPVPAFQALLMALRVARLGQPDLEAAIAGLHERARQARSSYLPSWPPLYREALSLIPAVLQAQAALDQRAALARQERDRQWMLQAAGQSVQSALAQAANDWGPRVGEQTSDSGSLVRKIEAAIDELPIESAEDAAVGQTRFAFEPEALASFTRGWLSEVEQHWARNNGELVAVRANELLSAAGLSLPPGVSFEIAPATLDVPALQLKLEGHSIATPSAMELVGATFKAGMAGFASVSGLGLVLSRFASKNEAVTSALTAVCAVGLVLAFVVAAVTVPKRIRQGREAVRLRAQREVREELRRALRKRVDSLGQHFLQRIRRHLSNEQLRWRGLSRPSLPDAGPGGALPQAGLSPADLERLRGEWRLALEQRLRELAYLAPGY